MKLAEAYSLEHPALRPFYVYGWRKPDWSAIARRRDASPVNRPTLLAALSDQYAELRPIPAAQASLERLVQPDALTVTTGQQPALFGGPMYNLYKAATAIATARQAEAALGRPVVPVFWVAGEDHDRDELDHTWLDFIQPLRYQALGEGPVGRHVIKDEIDRLTDRQGLARECWRPGTSWGDAFRRWLHELFGPWGMLVLDADDSRLKAAAADLWTAELFGTGVCGAVLEQTAGLQAAGFHQQLHPRPVNLFWMEDGFRERVEKTENGFQTADASRHWTEAEMRRAVAESPDRLSPNAALRPLYQERLLPNLAYVGGWGELAYWLQLGGAFAMAGLPYPLLVPRLRARLWTQEQERRRLALGLPTSFVVWSEAELTERMARKLRPDSLPDGWPDRLNAVWTELEDWIVAEAPEHIAGARGMRLRLERYQRRLSRRLDRRALMRQPGAWRAALALKRAVEADGRVQERYLNLMAWPELDAQALVGQLIDGWNYGDTSVLDIVI